MKILLKQAFGFFGLSGIGWLMDMTIYTIFTSIGFPTIVSNIISSGVAVTFVYIVSTKKMFINKNESFDLEKKYIMYIVYQIVVICVFSFIISKLAISLESVSFLESFAKISAKIIVTPFTMLINFAFMKFLIEKV